MVVGTLELNKLKGHAWKYGHFRNPAYQESFNVAEAELPALTLDDEAFRQAIASVQESDCCCDELCHMHHGRALELNDDDRADGDPGPATLAMLDIRRCHVPDFAVENDEFGLAGAGAWSNCDAQRNFHHEVVIQFDDRNAPPKWKGYLNKVKKSAVEISADMGLSVRYTSPGDGGKFQSSVIFKFIAGGVVGFYYLPQSSGCNKIPQGALDTSFLPDVHIASLLWIHEGVGHGVGLRHRRARRDANGVLRGIENPSIVRVPLTWRGDPSEGDMKRLYGGIPLVGDDPEPPPPGPTEWEITNGSFEIKVGENTNKFRIIEDSGV